MGSDDIFKKRKAEKNVRKNSTREVYKDRWLFVSEGEKTEINYFKGLVDFFENETGYKIDIQYYGTGQNTKGVVRKATETEEKRIAAYHDYRNKIKKETNLNENLKIVCAFDKDSFLPVNFNEAIALCNKNGYTVAWSNECFELWLFLHFDYLDSALTRQTIFDKLTDKFREANIFNSTQNYVDDGKNLENIFEAIIQNGGTIQNAISNSKRLCDNCGLLDNEKLIYDKFADMNPCLTVHKIVEALAKECGYKLKTH